MKNVSSKLSHQPTSLEGHGEVMGLALQVGDLVNRRKGDMCIRITVQNGLISQLTGAPPWSMS